MGGGGGGAVIAGRGGWRGGRVRKIEPESVSLPMQITFVTYHLHRIIQAKRRIKIGEL